jgi:hypothetical protein
MYLWAVVFAGIGLKAFLDMFVFIAILSAGIAYAWGMRGCNGSRAQKRLAPQRPGPCPRRPPILARPRWWVIS